MKNKLFFRILGALASGLYIFSVFVPLSNISSMTLWDASKGEMYLPIMLIVFGFLGVLLFALNRKIELIYTSVGVALYYLVIQTSTAVGLKVFGNLGMGYYFLLIGTVIMGLMTFICTLKGNETHTYTFTIGITERGTQQDHLQGKSFVGILEVSIVSSDGMRTWDESTSSWKKWTNS